MWSAGSRVVALHNQDHRQFSFLQSRPGNRSRRRRRLTIMKKRLPISIVAVVLLCVVRAHAQSDHTFVSTGGVDNATCGAFGTPCRTCAGALPQTNSGGEIIALTSGLYDDANITISKNITLTAAPGIHA